MLVWSLARGYILYYGDALAHLNTARRVIESRTPGLDQLGTPWLPLPHLLMLPLAGNDKWWSSGLAGAIPSVLCYVLAVVFLYCATRGSFTSRAAGATAALVFGLNPNVLYLSTTPMTEPVFWACLMAALYGAVRFAKSRSLGAALGTGAAAMAASLTRYEGWFLIPFLALYFFWRGRWTAALVFLLAACVGPLAWMAHNWWHFGDFFAFYNGPHSHRAIQGVARYPGYQNWAEAWLQYRAAVWLCAGTPLIWLGGAGLAAALGRKVFWPLLLLALPGAFYVWSVYSGGTPIFVPHLWPHSYYNTRYGMALLPLAAFAAGSLAAWGPARLRWGVALLVGLGAGLPWILHPGEENWITWKEAQVNSVARRAWTASAAEFLRDNYRPGAGIFTTFGDVSGVFAAAGIPLRETLTWDNGPVWTGCQRRPEVFLREEWVVAVAGDPVQSTVQRAYLRGPRYTLEKTIVVKGAPALEIYRRESLYPNENTVLEGPRRAQ